MNLFTDFEARIKNALDEIDLVREKRSELDFGRIAVEPPRDVTHGDVATNAAMVLAKPLGTNPRAFAEIILGKPRPGRSYAAARQPTSSTPLERLERPDDSPGLADEILDVVAEQLRRFQQVTGLDGSLHPDCVDDANTYVHGALEQIALAREILHNPAA